VRVRISGMDLLTLDLHATLAARLDAPPAAVEDSAEEDEGEPVVALHIAIELDESPPAADAPPHADGAAAASAATPP
jgi:exoribonuclease-2